MYVQPNEDIETREIRTAATSNEDILSAAAMDRLFQNFAGAHRSTNGYLLASTICPEPPHNDPARLYEYYRSSNAQSIQTDLRYKLQYNPEMQLEKKESTAWLEVFVVFYQFTGVLLEVEEVQHTGRASGSSWSSVYESWKAVVQSLYRGYQSGAFAAWTIPCLYTAGKYLRVFAIKADEQLASQRDGGLGFRGLQEDDVLDPSSKNDKLEDAARQINRIFGLCISDRNPLENSRKWALYYIANLLFKTYFKLNSTSLSKNILQSLRASTADMPPLSAFPRAHQVTFKYYCGVIHFLQEDYTAAEEYLVSAYEMCSRHATRNMQLILTYLIPTKLITSHKLPTTAMLAPYPSLAALFSPVISAIRRTDLTAFNAALEHGENEFVKRRIYLTLERGRDVILRNLFRKVYMTGGMEAVKEGAEASAPQRRTRVPVSEFAAALMLAGAEVSDGEGGVDSDEVECLIANAIYKNLMKGYIARERGIVVLSKAGAFPGTGV